MLRNRAPELKSILAEISNAIGPMVSDYELIVVDNASDDGSSDEFYRLTLSDGLPNLQVYALAKEVDLDTASWVGLENALGDFVAVLDPFADDINFLPTMLDRAVKGLDVVFASNSQQGRQGIAYRFCSFLFNSIYKSISGVNLAKEAPQYRVLSRRLVNLIHQHSMPAVSYRHLPATSGYAKVTLGYSSEPRDRAQKSLSHSVDRGMRLIVSTTRVPMRLVTSLSLFGAVANLAYSVYVICIALFKETVAPGWVTLSLQQSGMFFLISLVLLVLGEYMLHMASLTDEGPCTASRGSLRVQR
ncbi:glycosyltransferase [Variovorax ureilyticus]|uniref:glycosyltransferase n=1 Tax=Variovorax ureilyticus TaxID=1836198 RepID=UPI003D674E1E